MRGIYLDNNATTPVHPDVLDAMLPFYREAFGNPSCIHWAGKLVRDALKNARSRVASLINCDPAEVVFTSGGSEALNMAIKGVASAKKEKGNHIVTTMVEHPAVFNCCRYLEREGYRVTYLGVDSDGMLDLNELEATLTDRTILISAMYANNETGVVFPVEEIGRIASDRGVYFLCDAVQAVGKAPVDFKHIRADLLAVSGHKLHAPKGVGALVVREGTKCHPLLHGGSQERNRRAGTENVAGIVGFGKACELAAASLEEEVGCLRGLRDSLESGLMARIDGVKRNGHPERRLANTANLSFRKAYSELLLDELNREGIAVSAGSACSSGSRELSRVLTAMGKSGEIIGCSVRFSLGRENTAEEIERVLEVLPPIVERLRDNWRISK